MKGLRKNMRIASIVFIILFALLGIYFIYAINVYGGRWFNNPYNRRLQERKSNVVAGAIVDRTGAVLARTNSEGERQYSEDKTTRLAVSHVVGDGSGLTSTGAENFLANYLLGFNNNVFERVYQQFSGGKARGSDVKLTIDADLSAYVSEVMGKYDGAVVLLNYKTGEVLSMVSHPMYDPNKITTEGTESFAKTALVNRATMGRYTPGSVFKIITTTAGIRYIPNATERTWTGDGPLVYDAKTRNFLPDVLITQAEDKRLREEQQNKPAPTPTPDEEADEDGASVPDEEKETGGILDNRLLLRNYQSNYFGTITLERAFAKSCNNTMARIAMEVGPDKMAKTAKDLGFDTDFLFHDMVVYGSQYDRGKNQYDLSWSSVGQYKDLVTPMHMAMIAGAIGNDGVMMEPKLLRSVINTRQHETLMLKPKTYSQTFSAEEAEILTEYMRTTITDGTGSAAAISGVKVCGKTGTAEVSSDKKVGNHAWFVGFIDGEDHPLAIAVVLEHAGSGGGKAAPVAGKVLQRAIKAGY